jgi:hypothetical protein
MTRETQASKTPLLFNSRRRFLLGAGAAAITLLAGCGLATATVPPRTEAPRPLYHDWVEAYDVLGEAAVPKPLEGIKKDNGLIEYKIQKPDGIMLPIDVYSVGPLSFAPGEHFANILNWLGLFGKLEFSSGEVLDGLQKIRVFVFNENTHITPQEVKKMQELTGQKFNVFNKQTNQIEKQIGLLSIVPAYSAVTQEELEKNYEKFVAIQKQHKDELWSNLFSIYDAALTADYSQLSPAGREHVLNYWNKLKSQSQDGKDRGITPIGAVSGQFRYFPMGQANEWEAVMLVHVNPETIFAGADANYMAKENGFVKAYSIKNEPRVYSALATGTFVPLHELSHARMGENEVATDQTAITILEMYGKRIQKGDFRADFVPINMETQETVTNNFPKK